MRLFKLSYLVSEKEAILRFLLKNKVRQALKGKLSVDQRWLSALIITLLSLPSSLALAPSSWSQEKASETKQGQLRSPDIQKRLDDIEFLAEKAGAGQEIPIQPEVIKQLVGALKDPNLEVRRMAVDALTGIGTGAEDAVEPLADILQDQKQPADLRRNAIAAIQSIYAGYAVKPLIKALDDPDPDVRGKAAIALGSIREKAKDAVPKLISLVEEDPYGDVRAKAAQVLGNIDPNNNQQVSSTLNEALKDRSWRVRSKSADSLAKIGAPAKEALSNLRMALDNKNNTLVNSAAQALGALGALGSEDKKVVPALKKVLQDNKNSFTRGQAAYALGKIGADDPTTLEALTDALNDQASFVRTKAFESFKEIAIPMADKLLAQNEIKSDELQKTIDYFEEALGQMDSLNSGFSEEQKYTLRPALKRLKSKQTEEAFINVIVKNPWVWGVIAYLALHLGLFWLRPLWLLKIDEVVKPLSFKVPILGMELSPRFLLFLKFRSRVLDAWVATHIQSVQEEFQKKENVEARKVYIPSPATIDGRTVPQVTSQDLRDKLKKPLLIWGEGGVGKTSLSFQIAQWAMADKENERLYQHRMLPILIEEDLDCQGEACKQALIDAILGQLKILTNEEEPISEELLERLLRRRRILVIVDHLSEMGKQTQETIDPEQPDFPINALIVTSRQHETLGHVSKIVIKPLRIIGNRLSSFMEAYLMQEGKRDLFTDSEFFDACSRLSRMVGQKAITAMLATLYAKQLINAKVEAVQDISALVSDNIPDLMITYLSQLNRDLTDTKSDQDQYDNRTVHQDAKAIAWACVQESYYPAPIKRETAIAALADRGEQAEDHLMYLEERLHLIQTIGATEDHIRFSLDPLAEYLAGLHLIDIYKGDESQWLEFLEQAQAKPDSPAAISGFLGAVQDCCLAKGKEEKISPLILTKLAQILNKDTQFVTSTIGSNRTKVPKVS